MLQQDAMWRRHSHDNMAVNWSGSNDGEQEDALFEFLEDLSENDLNQLRGVVDLTDVLPLKSDPLLGDQHPPITQLKQEPFVDNSSSLPPLPSSNLPEMKLTLYHKPRGSGGIWKPVAEGDAIRVTKDKGKKLRLRVECNFDFDWNELDVALVDLVSYQEVRQGFTLDLSKSTIKSTFAEIELNLIRICKKLQFAVVLKSKHGWTCNGRTITFIAHNNGKERVKLEPLSSHEPSPTTSPMPSPGTVTTPPQSVWPAFGAPSPTEFLQTQAGGKKRKVDSDCSPDSQAETITTIPGPLNVQGVVRATGFIQYSDLRLKTNVQDLVDALQMVQDLQAKTYYWKTSTDAPEEVTGGKRVIGLIAQEVQRVVPEVVHEDPDTGLLAVSYTELVPVLLEALKQHLGGYAKDKEAFQKELDDLKEQMQSLAVSKHTENHEIDNTVIAAVKARTNNFVEPMTMEEVTLVTRWAKQYHVKLEAAIRRNIRQALKAEKKQKWRQGQAEGNGERQHGRRGNRSPADREIVQKKKFEQHLMLDPMKTQSAVLRFGTKMFRLASKRNSKLVVVLFWRRGFVDDLDLHLYREEGPLSLFHLAKQNRGQRRKVIGVVGSDSDSYHGTYKILVQLKGQASAYHLQQSKAVVAVFDFRLAGALPLWMMATSSCGDLGGNWVVGSFVVARSVLQWQTRPNMVVSKLPPEWIIHSEGLSMSDPLPIGSNRPAHLGTLESSKVEHPGQAVQAEQSKAGKGAPPPPRRVFLRSYHGAYLSSSPEGKVLCLPPRKESPDGPLIPHIAEAWDMEFDRYGAAFLRSSYGHYLSAQSSFLYSVSVSADRDFPGPDGRETFFPLLDDREHTLGLITSTGHYIYADEQHRLVGAPTVPSLYSPSETSPDNDGLLKSSAEFYRMMSEGCRAFLEQNQEGGDGKDILSSSFEFYQHLSRGGSVVAQELFQEEEKVDMKGTFELYKHLSDGATKGLQEEKKSNEDKAKAGGRGAAEKPAVSFMNFHLPTQEQKWFFEVAPSREAQQALLAQEAYQKTQHLRLIYSIHSGVFERKV